MIKENDQVQVVNKDLHIATVDSKTGEFEAELIVEQGRGYQTVESRDNSRLEAGVIGIDAMFSPVRSVHFDVSNVRVGQLTNFDKLVVTLETDGSMDGREAFDIASNILVDHFTMMFSEGAVAPAAMVPAAEETTEEAPAEETMPVGESDIETSQLSTRAKNALAKNSIRSIEQLKGLSADDLANLSGLGDKTLQEISDFVGR
jgi:DNA-directed RNA polymerase subunit alpha